MIFNLLKKRDPSFCLSFSDSVVIGVASAEVLNGKLIHLRFCRMSNSTSIACRHRTCNWLHVLDLVVKRYRNEIKIVRAESDNAVTNAESFRNKKFVHFFANTSNRILSYMHWTNDRRRLVLHYTLSFLNSYNDKILGHDKFLTIRLIGSSVVRN